MIVIVDFGSQYTHLITKHLNHTLKVSTSLIPYTRVNEITDFSNVKGIILSGGPQSVSEMDENYNKKLYMWFKKCLSHQIPALGVCFGLQWLAHFYGGKVQRALIGEYGATVLTVIDNDLTPIDRRYLIPLTNGRYSIASIVWMSHEDNVTELPTSFEVLGTTENCPYAFVYNRQDRVYGTQFHPEVEQTDFSKMIYKNFAIEVCHCIPIDGDKSKILETTQAELRKQYSTTSGSGNILLALSGGVDSTVVCHLLAKTLPHSKVFCIFVNNGLMRKGESKEIKKRFEFLGANFLCYDAKKQFRDALKGISEPEQKRKIIGKMFISTFDHIVNINSTEYEWLAQGTIYPDIIESSGLNGTAKVIKSHHNVGGLPDTMKLKVLEPLKYLFKDQVKELGCELGIESSILNRHPFPGPGLGIRIVGEVTPEFIKIVKVADKIFIDALKDAGFYNNVSQAYAGLFPVKTVGVVGDNRRYEWVIVLRSVTTIDFMTATASNQTCGGIDLVFLSQVATKIINTCSSVSRVVYDITSKPPGTIEME
jgi:GMP synthase (glutamine-hydrolysing)